MHQAKRWMWDRTYGGAGRRKAGSSAERGTDVEISIRVVLSEKVLDMVIVSRGLCGRYQNIESADVQNTFTWTRKFHS